MRSTETSLTGPDLQAIRETLGMTRRELAVALGYPDGPHPATIYDWETDRVRIRHPEILRRAVRDLERERRPRDPNEL
jgi:DNA-binding transcriptional regulator YiaG